MLEFVIEPLEKRGERDSESSDVQWIPMEQALELDLAFDHKGTVRSYDEFRRRHIATPILI